ncbi:class I SAM-dependent methyltransferase [Cellulomonas phragmiteti]|uniref:Methyltransferase n=1 Tax=Cellulomonas phragmiteti TaxID=478780 RepID=A0ABQ4DLQ7_9CELL|nr:class I SAM-dependent methyltransferase [Cellulomonas phragmiteti]GIG40293.1 methyltransferase [Cellulomonas phragmiteti]
MTGVLDAAVAAEWVESWDRQQERYAVARDERFAVVCEVVAAVTRSEPTPVVVDLGCGPGSLTVRVARRVPRARTLGVDADPLLLALGRAASPDVELVEAVVGAPGWTDVLPARLDAVVSSTALHYLPPDALGTVYADLAVRLRPGGVLVNADHLPADDVVLDVLGRAVARRRTSVLATPAPDALDWSGWWEAVARDPRLHALRAQRVPQPAVAGEHVVPVGVHNRLLLAGGFSRCGVVWRDGPSAVLVAVR